MTRDVAPLPGYPETYGLLAAILQDATQDWRGELFDETIGPDAMSWQVRPGSYSMGAVMLHMAAVEVFWFEEFPLGRQWDPEERKLLQWDETDVDKGVWASPPAEDFEWYCALLDKVRTRTLNSIKEWPPSDSFISRWEKQTSLRWVFGHVIQHESYHGGQVVMLHELWKSKAQG